MSKLEEKYRNSYLTLEELRCLREEVNSMSDEQLEESLRKTWELTEVSSVESRDLDKLKNKIDNKIFSQKHTIPLYVKVLRIAAVILLPILLVSTIYLYRENTLLGQKEFVASTGEGEQVTLSLPDGTKVTLNANSYLSYNLSEYNSKNRRIEFNGEGYFRVVKMSTITPFSIETNGLVVSVLGTTFNLCSYSSDATAELFLEEGRVSLHSLKTGQNLTLLPNQKAIFHQDSGMLTIEKDNYVTDASAWRRGELVFRNVPLENVLEKISEVYHVSIVVGTRNEKFKEDLFTGVLSRTNINEALEVIEHSYHLKAVLNNGEIKLVNLQ